MKASAQWHGGAYQETARSMGIKNVVRHLRRASKKRRHKGRRNASARGRTELRAFQYTQLFQRRPKQICRKCLSTPSSDHGASILIPGYPTERRRKNVIVRTDNAPQRRDVPLVDLSAYEQAAQAPHKIR
jgi:hypothetical protein